MNRLSKYICGFFLMILCGYLMPLNAQQYYAQQQPAQTYAVPTPPNYYMTPSEYNYNQNNPYANSYGPSSYAPNGFYGGFYGSPPPPTPAQAFPDKAASDNLYRYLQSR